MRASQTARGSPDADESRVAIEGAGSPSPGMMGREANRDDCFRALSKHASERRSRRGHGVGLGFSVSFIPIV
jgi:hypothetical protein